MNVPLTQYQALQQILTETAGTELPIDLDEARDRILRIAALVSRATRSVLDDLEIVNGWLVDTSQATLDTPFAPGEPPEPIVRLSDLPGYETLLDNLTPAQWAYTPEGHDAAFEYTTSSDCDGSNVQRFRRRPARAVPASEWQKVDEIPPVEQRTLRPLYDEEPRP